MLDGARVLQFAHVDTHSRPPGGFSLVVGGVPVDLAQAPHMVIAEDLVKGGAFLMHCNDNWETIAAAHYIDVASAREAADAAFAGVTVHWSDFRALTAAERHEVETTRAFLRELASEFPSD